MGPRMILVGYDGSAASQHAIDDLHRAGLALRGMVAVLSVADAGVVDDLAERAHPTERLAERETIRSVTMNRLQREALEDAIALSLEGGALLRRRLPEWHVDTLVMMGRPARSLLVAARDCSAELIVVGSHGRSSIERALLGSVSLGIAADAHCPVRIGRGRDGFGDGPLRIVLGIDRHSTLAETLHSVAVRDWPLGTAVHVIVAEHVAITDEAAATEAHSASDAASGAASGTPPALSTIGASSGRETSFETAPASTAAARPAVVRPGTTAESPPAARADETAASGTEVTTPRLYTALVELGWRGLRATTRVVDGAIERAVLDAARQWGADLVVVGADDADAAVRIAARAECTVEIVRPLRLPFVPPPQSPAD